MEDVSSVLSRIRFRLLTGLEPAAFEVLKDCFSRRVFNDGETLLRIGEESFDIFFVVDGSVKIEIPLVSGRTNERIATLSAGNTAGEFSLVRIGKVTANAAAVGTVEALWTNRDRLQRVLLEKPEIGCRVYQNLSSILVDRLVDTNLLARNVLSQMCIY